MTGSSPQAKRNAQVRLPTSNHIGFHLPHHHTSNLQLPRLQAHLINIPIYLFPTT